MLLFQVFRCKVVQGGDAVLKKRDDELDVMDVAERLGVRDRTVRYWVSRNVLRPDRVERTSEKRSFYFFKPETVAAYQQYRKGAQVAPTENV